jgi:23S rRNA pseudouridine2605 synthase
LNRYLARCGAASRRGADALIASGRVRVNGLQPPPQGMLIEPGRDQVTLNGRPLVPPARHRYLVLHKPVGTLVTARDPQGRPTVFDLVPDGGRLFAVGRLDAATEGLLLLTDDGELAHRLAHPRHRVPKEYVARVEGLPSERDLNRLRAGVELDDGRTLPAVVELLDAARGQARLRLVISEGRNRQVRRMLEAVGHPVVELIRTGFGPLRLGRLNRGGVRRLRPAELAALRRAAGLEEEGGPG